MYNLLKLNQTANLLRRDVLQMLCEADSGHSASSLGLVEVFTVLYFYLLNHNPQKPNWMERDRLIVSNGHVCPLWYATLARAGYFPVVELSSLRKLGSKLQGHPCLGLIPGVENSSGSIGQGLSWAVGVALAGKRQAKNYRVVCITSDGEHQEGEIWEAYLLASKYKLDNLIVFLDSNEIQIDGFVSQILPIEPIKAKLASFGCWVAEVDGHNMENIIDVYLKAKTIIDQPVVIINHTIAGKGVSFMESNPKWHGKAPNKLEAKKALEELKNENFDL